MTDTKRLTNDEIDAAPEAPLDDEAADLALQAIRELGHAIDREEFRRWLARRFDLQSPLTVK